MVWPILISVAVTPRISAAVAARGHASATSAPATPNPVTKRIAALPACLVFSALNGGRAGRGWRAPFATKHGMAAGSAPIIIVTGAMRKSAYRIKNAASPPRFRFRTAMPLRLRLRLQPGIRIGPRARLAGRRHRRGARRGRLQHRLAVGLLALQQILDFVAAQGFEFQQALGQRFQVGALFGENARRFVVALFDETPDLGVDLLHRRLRGVLGP